MSKASFVPNKIQNIPHHQLTVLHNLNSPLSLEYVVLFLSIKNKTLVEPKWHPYNSKSLCTIFIKQYEFGGPLLLQGTKKLRKQTLPK